MKPVNMIPFKEFETMTIENLCDIIANHQLPEEYINEKRQYIYMIHYLVILRLP